MKAVSLGWTSCLLSLFLITSTFVSQSDARNPDLIRHILDNVTQKVLPTLPQSPQDPPVSKFFTTVPGETARRVLWYEDLNERGYQYRAENHAPTCPDNTVFMDFSGLKDLRFYNSLLPTHKISSFPSVCSVLTHKANLPRAIREYYRERGIQLPSRDHFMIGETYDMYDPMDRIDFDRLMKKDGPNSKWLVKPTTALSRRGKGIFSYDQSCGHTLAASKAQDCPPEFFLKNHHIVQKFADKAKSINDHFMTARWVFLITSLDPLRIYALPLTVITSASPMKRSNDGSVDFSYF